MIAGTGGSFPPQSKKIDDMYLRGFDSAVKVGIITAATTKSTQTFFDFLSEKFKQYGLQNIEYLDLYDASWKEKIKSVKIVYIAGGNTFKLLDIMHKSGFVAYVQQNKDKHTFAGFSAGATILGADISSCNDANDLGIKETAGLQLVDVLINPHYKEDSRKERLQNIANKLKRKIICLTDDQGFYKSKDSDELKFIGNPLILSPQI